MTDWGQLRAVAERRHGVVTTADLHAAGLSRRQVGAWSSRGRLVDIGPGVWRIAGTPDSFESQVLGAILGLDDDAWASHVTAARLWGLRLHGPLGAIELTRLYGCSTTRGAVRLHRSTLVPGHHVTVHRGVPVTTVPRTLFDLARRASPRLLDRAIEEALRSRLCTVGALHRVAIELGGRGRPGTRKMRTALESRGVDYIPTSSELTAVGRAVMATVPGIEWEVPMADHMGYIRTVDAFVRPARVVIEFDGSRYHDQPSDVSSDADGDDRLVAMGNVVHRLGWIALTRRPESTRAMVDRLVSRGAA